MSGLELVHFESDEKLFIEGERTFFFYMIKEGEVEVYRETPDGQKTVLAVVEAGQSLGEFAMIDKQPRSASARALGHVVAVQISEEAYGKLLSDLPTWAQAMMEGLVSRLRKANEIIQQSEDIDDKTKTSFETSEFDLSHETEINIETDFSDLKNIEIPDVNIGKKAS